MPFDGTQNTVADTLRAARALIERPEQWIKNHHWNTDHTAFCAKGAIMREVGPVGWSEIESARGAVNALNQAAQRRRWATIELFNDYTSTTHADILALFDEAIASVEAGS